MLLLSQHSLELKSEHDTSVTGIATDKAVMKVPWFVWCIVVLLCISIDFK